MKISSTGTICRLIAAVACCLSLAACDTLMETTTVSSDELLEAAKVWHQDQLAQDAGTAKSGNDAPDPAALLDRFFPDWQTARLITDAAGNTILVATLGPDARVSFDATRSIVRTLLVTFGGEGQVASGEIVEFVSSDPADLEHIEALVTGYMQKDFGEKSILVARYSVRFSPRQATIYQPAKASVDVGFEIKECNRSELPSKMAETINCVIVDVITYAVCVGDSDCPWNTDVYIDCWELDGTNDDQASGGGGGGSSGGGGNSGGGGSDEGDEYDLGDIVSKSDLEEIFEGCGLLNDKDQDAAYEEIVRNALYMNYRAASGEIVELDGYYSSGELGIFGVMETKFSESSVAFSFKQSKKHIDELSEVYTRMIEPNTVYFPPFYFAVSQYAGEDMRLDWNDDIVGHAESKGVLVSHVTIRELGLGHYILVSNILTDWNLTYEGVSLTLPDWVQLPNSPVSLPFTISCNDFTS